MRRKKNFPERQSHYYLVFYFLQPNPILSIWGYLEVASSLTLPFVFLCCLLWFLHFYLYFYWFDSFPFFSWWVWLISCLFYLLKEPAFSFVDFCYSLLCFFFIYFCSDFCLFYLSYSADLKGINFHFVVVLSLMQNWTKVLFFQCILSLGSEQLLWLTWTLSGCWNVSTRFDTQCLLND